MTSVKEEHPSLCRKSCIWKRVSLAKRGENLHNISIFCYCKCMAVPLISFWSFVCRLPCIQCSVRLNVFLKRDLWPFEIKKNWSFCNAWLLHLVVVLYYLNLIWFTYLDMGLDFIILTVFGSYQLPMFCSFNMIVSVLQCSYALIPCDSNLFFKIYSNLFYLNTWW